METPKTPAREAAAALIELVRTQPIEVGEHLPSERRLAELLGVTRGHVRSAIKELEHQGMLQVVPQVGTLVKAKNPATNALARVLNMDSMDLQSLIEVRVSLEVTAAGLAAKRATAEDIAAIEQACAAYTREVGDLSPWQEQNQRFHMSIVYASHNGAIIAIMENLLNDVIALTRSKRSAYTHERLNRSVREHEAIAEAIKNRDETAALREMGLHMREMSAIADKLALIME